ncbi:MAG: hypothetical protein HW398_1124 [Acidobacteria bacterium]|nr:hypothetical protein [Acidobacteriota bacterium]
MVCGLARSKNRAVILRPADRQIWICGMEPHGLELRNSERGVQAGEAQASVGGPPDAAIADQVKRLWVRGIKDDVALVLMQPRRLAQIPPGVAEVRGLPEIARPYVDDSGVARVHAHKEVESALALAVLRKDFRRKTGDEAPGDAAVERAVEAVEIEIGGANDERIHERGIRRGGSQGDSPDGFLAGQTLRHSGPGFAAVRAAVDPVFGTAGEVSDSSVGQRRVGGIEGEVRDRAPQDRAPARAAVARLPERRRAPDQERPSIPGIKPDDRSRGREKDFRSHALPGRAAVARAIDAGAVVAIAAKVQFPGPVPDIAGEWVHGDRPGGEGRKLIRQGLPALAAVRGFPDTASRRRRVYGRGIARVYGEAGHAPADHIAPGGNDPAGAEADPGVRFRLGG